MNYSLGRTTRLALVVGALLLSACGEDEALVAPELDVDDPQAFIIDGRVEFLPLEGGCWSILADDDTRYEPLGLPEEFRVHGLRVRAALKLRSDLASICMIGTIVDVVEIEAYSSS